MAALFSMPPRVAIVGGGVAGSLAAIMLAKQPTAIITVFDGSGAFGRGLAYSATAPWHRINVPAAKMKGTGADDPDGFVDWLTSTGQADWQDYSDSFVPRSVYGDYLSTRMSDLTASGRVVTHRETVTQITAVGDAYELATDAGARLEADLVFLCLGNPAPSPFPGIPATMRSITNVWAEGALEPIGSDDRVLVIGTGATAVDMVIDLVHRGMRQPITMISRRGLLPLVDAPTQEDPAPIVDWRERTARGIFAELLADARRKMAAGLPWQAVIDGFRLQIADLWSDASDSERRLFARHLRSIWLVHRHRLAPDVAHLLDELRSSGRLDVMAGRITDAVAEPDGFSLTIRQRGGGTLQLAPQWILNCTGPEERYGRIANPLVRTMLADGLARPGQNGLGLDVNEMCQIIDRAGQSRPGLYAIGHATRGAFWEVTAATNIRQQLLRVTEALIKG